MCGRYYRTADKQAIAEQFHATATTDEPLPPGYNIAPSTIQPIIRQPAIRAHASSPACVGAGRLRLAGPDPNAPPSMLAPTTSSAAASGAPRCISAAAWSRSRVSLSGASPTRRRSDSHSRSTDVCLRGHGTAGRRPTATGFRVLDYHRGGSPEMRSIHDRMLRSSCPAIMTSGSIAPKSSGHPSTCCALR